MIIYYFSSYIFGTFFFIYLARLDPYEILVCSLSSPLDDEDDDELSCQTCVVSLTTVGCDGQGSHQDVVVGGT